MNMCSLHQTNIQCAEQKHSIIKNKKQNDAISQQNICIKQKSTSIENKQPGVSSNFKPMLKFKKQTNHEWIRFLSFQVCPDQPDSFIYMAKCGLYYNQEENNIKCYSCGFSFSFIKTLGSFREYSRHHENCLHLLGKDNRNIPANQNTLACIISNDFKASLERTLSLDSTIQLKHTSQSNKKSKSFLKIPPLTRVVITQKPKYPEYAVTVSRIKTLEDINNLSTETALIAVAGFFYSKSENIIRCFSCGGGLKNFMYMKDAWAEHAKHFPECSFVIQNKGHEYVESLRTAKYSNQDVYNYSVRAKDMFECVSGLGFDNKHLERAFQIFEFEGGNLSISEFLEILSDLESGSFSDIQLLPTNEENDVSFLLKQYCKEKLKELCVVCEENKCVVALLPCADLCTCLECFKSLSKCPKCEMTVKSCVRVFTN